MYIGNQRVRIDIYRNVETGVNEYGEAEVEATLWKSTWAQMASRRGNEHIVGSEVFSLSYWIFTCRYLSVKGVKPTDWIVHEGQTYEIRNIMPDEQRHDYCTIEARIRNVNMQPGSGDDVGGDLSITLQSEFEKAYVGEFYMGGIPDVAGGDGAYTYSIVGALPAGLTIDAGTGIISGVPAEVTTDPVEFAIKVTDGAGAEAVTDTLEIEVSAYT